MASVVAGDKVRRLSEYALEVEFTTRNRNCLAFVVALGKARGGFSTASLPKKSHFV
jgi:hypothetical protein